MTPHTLEMDHRKARFKNTVIQKKAFCRKMYYAVRKKWIGQKTTQQKNTFCDRKKNFSRNNFNKCQMNMIMYCSYFDR